MGCCYAAASRLTATAAHSEIYIWLRIRSSVSFRPMNRVPQLGSDILTSLLIKNIVPTVYWGHTGPLCTVLRALKKKKKKKKKCILGSYDQEFGSEMRLRDSWVEHLHIDRCYIFWIWPRIRAVVAHHCSEHISDRKDAFGKFMNSTPPIWDLSRESWDARSDP